MYKLTSMLKFSLSSKSVTSYSDIMAREEKELIYEFGIVPYFIFCSKPVGIFLAPFVSHLLLISPPSILHSYTLPPDVNWGSSTQAFLYSYSLRNLLKLEKLGEHVKNFRSVQEC